MKVTNLLEIVQNCDSAHEWEDLAKDIFSGYVYEYSLLKELKNKWGISIKIEDHHGGEGMGDKYWSVFSATHDGDVAYYRLSGWYASYEGASLDDTTPELVNKVPVQTYEWQSV
jgi:hypothetical protein